MSNAGGIGGPRDPTPQQIPDDPNDDTIDISETFADDVLGAQLKKAEADKEKQARDRRAAEQKRRLANWAKVQEASTFGGTEGESAHRALLKAQQKADQPAVQKVEREANALGSATLETKQQEVAEIFSEIQTLLEEIDKAGGLGQLAKAQQAAAQAKLEGQVARLLQLSQRLTQLEEKVKAMLMALLTGAFGFKLLGDPRLTFRRLFERLQQWPAQIPPGHEPKSDEDFDQFVAWIFKPPIPNEDLAEDLRLLR